jgi:hypothetical protein
VSTGDISVNAEALKIRNVPGEDRLLKDIGSRPDDHVAVADRCAVVL